MITIPEISFRIHEFELVCLLDQLRGSNNTRIKIILKDRFPDQIEFDWTGVAILTREEDWNLPF